MSDRLAGSRIKASQTTFDLEAFFESQIVHFVPYDVEDGGFNPQVLFIFKDANGNILPSADTPRIITAKSPGDPFYSSIWEVWAVTVPTGFDISTITSAKQIVDNGVQKFPVSSTGIRMNCPVVSINGVAFPFEDAFALLDRLLHQGPGGAFDPNIRTPIGFPDITPELARESGFLGLIDLLKVAKHGKGENIYLIRFHYVRPRSKGP